MLAKYWHKEVINVACSQTPRQVAEQMFSHSQAPSFHLWTLTVTPAFVGSVLICPCTGAGVLQVSVSQTLLPINIAWGAVTNPNAQAPMNSDSLGVGLRHLWFLELPSVQLENLFSSSVKSLEDLV